VESLTGGGEIDTAAEPTRTRSALPELDLYRIGGIAGIAGGILGVVANALHPRQSPSDLGDTESFLDMAAGYSLWRLDHLAVIFALALGVVAFVALARSITDLPAAAWARVALALGLVTGGVAAVSFAFDGFVLGGIAEDWASASGSARAQLLERARTLEYVDLGLLSVAVVGVFGVTQTLFGLALYQSVSYPNWIGATALFAGVVGLISGSWMWFSGGLDAGNFLVLFTTSSVLLTVWLLAGSVLLLRRARGAPDVATLKP
jgi:hypothetical protein